MEIPSRILEQAVEQLSRLPGVGKRSALRYALELMEWDESEVMRFTEAVGRLKSELKECKECHCASDEELCPICSSAKRQRDVICVVENIQQLMAIENTQQYRGLYHVLGGVISPIDGIGIQDLNIGTLVERVRRGEPHRISEVILALPTTLEGDTTNFYIHKQLAALDVKVTTLARGVAIGDNLEYADEITLGRAIIGRVVFG